MLVLVLVLVLGPVLVLVLVLGPVPVPVLGPVLRLRVSKPSTAWSTIQEKN